MRNIFLFIRRYIVFLAFLVLQALCLWFLFTYNRFHRAKGLGIANELTGWVSTRYNTVEDFFRMKEENKRVQRMNDSLLNLLRDNFVKLDTGQAIRLDTVRIDTSGLYRRYTWREAQVVYNTINSDKNYLQINRGSASGIHDDMGVFSSNGGLVGKVINTGRNYSQVMSLLHVQNKVNVILKKTGNAGNVSWDAKDPRFLTMTGIPKSDSVLHGDTVVTGSFSFSYPPGKMVGTVAGIVQDNSTNFYILKIKTAANFPTLQQVFVVGNMQYDEQMRLDEDTRKKVDFKKPATR